MCTQVLNADTVLPDGVLMLVRQRRTERAHRRLNHGVSRCVSVEREARSVKKRHFQVVTNPGGSKLLDTAQPRADPQRRVRDAGQALRAQQSASRGGDGVVQLRDGLRKPWGGRRRGRVHRRACHFDLNLRIQDVFMVLCAVYTRGYKIEPIYMG